MFTGLIEEVGCIVENKRSGSGNELKISAKKILEDVRSGDSIAINGVCQTVALFDGNSFSVYVSEVTKKLTTLGSFEPGVKVNLERAMPSNGRFGGHFVQGHVDGIGVVSSIQRDNRGIEINVDADDGLMKYIIQRGSIAADGVSLTVVKIEENGFLLYCIPETLTKSTIAEWKIGSKINIEADIIAKYVEKMIVRRDSGKILDKEGDLKKKLIDEGYI